MIPNAMVAIASVVLLIGKTAASACVAISTSMPYHAIEGIAVTINEVAISEPRFPNAHSPMRYVFRPCSAPIFPSGI